MLMEQDPVNVFSPWNNFSIGTALHSKENNLLNETDIFGKKNLFNHAPSNTPSYRHSDSSSPMSWSEVDNSSTSTGSRLSGIYDNGYSQDISNLWNKIEKNTNSGNLGLDQLKELASKDLSHYNNLYDRDTNEVNSTLNPIGTSSTTSIYNSNLFGCFEPCQKANRFLLSESNQANADNASLLKDILHHPDSGRPSNDSAYWSSLASVNSYGLSDLSTLDLSLANNSNALTSSFNSSSVDPNVQKNVIENLKRLRDLSQLTSELNLNPNLDQATPLYDTDGQFSAKDQSISQNMPPTSYDDIFCVGLEGNFGCDKLLSHCNVPLNHLENVTICRNNFREKLISSRQDHSHNQFLLAKTESSFGLPFFPESHVTSNGINTQAKIDADSVLGNPMQNVSCHDIYLQNAQMENGKKNYGLQDNLQHFGVAGTKNSGRSVKLDPENLCQPNLYNEELHPKETNSSFMPPVSVTSSNYVRGLPLNVGGLDNSFRPVTSFRAVPPVPPTFASSDNVSRPLRPYPPPSVDFCPPRPSLSHELHQCIEDCYEQFRQMEYERKETEVKLCNGFPNRRISCTNNLPIPRLPPVTSRVDRLIIDNFREHSKVVTLIGSMQDLQNTKFQTGIHKAVAYWHVAILQVQDKRNREIISAFNCRGFMPVNKYDYDMNSLVTSLHTLEKACKSARTSFFCALTLTNWSHQTYVVPQMDNNIVDELDEDPFNFIIKSRALRLVDEAASDQIKPIGDLFGGGDSVSLSSIPKRDETFEQGLLDVSSENNLPVNIVSDKELDLVE